MKKFLSILAFSLVILPAAIARADFDRDDHHDSDRHDRRDSNWNRGNNDYYGDYWYSPRYKPQYRDSALTQGVRDGRLTPNEVRELQRDKDEIRRDQAKYGADGRLSPRERDELRKDQNEYQKDLNHELNDGERRRW